MSRLRVPASGIGPGKLVLDDAASHYVVRVHRLGPGDEIEVFDPEARIEGVATLSEVRRGRVTCEVDRVRAASVVGDRPFWLLLGLTKNDAFEWVIREATAFGVTDIVPVVSQHTAVRVPEPGARREGRWRRIVVEGARQCGRGDIPKVHPPMALAAAMGACASVDAVRLCLWERATRGLGEVVGPGIDAAGVIVLVGPEGGFDASEALAAERAGFSCVLLGGLVLRAETAAIAAMGVVRCMWREVEPREMK